MDFYEYFKAMGKEITTMWKVHDYKEDALPNVAEEYFSNNNIHEEINVYELLLYMSKPNDLAPIQSFYNFSDLPVNVFKHPKFFIEVLFWSNGTTTTHNHAFSGCFYVVHGQSLNIEYDFKEKDKVNSRFRIGDFSINVAEHLKKGDYRKIKQGTGLIHTVFHLDKPSVSLVVRTYQNQDAMPQLEYRFPYIGLDPDQQDACVVKKFQALSVLRSINAPEFMSLFEQAINESSPDELYWIYRGFDFASLSDEEAASINSIIANTKYGKEILEVVRREKIVRHIVNLRAQTQDAKTRTILACLMNLPTRDAIIKYLTDNQQGEIKDNIALWLTTLVENSFISAMDKDQINDFSQSIVNADYASVDDGLREQPLLESFFR